MLKVLAMLVYSQFNMEYLSAFYNKFILAQKPQVVTDAEISLIQTYTEPGSKVLDIGSVQVVI